MLYITFAILSGVTIVLSRSINGMLADRIGGYQSTLFNYITGLLGSALLMFISGQTLQLFQISTYSATWWAYTGGLVGVFSVTLSSVLSNRIAAFYLTLLIFIGQLFTGVIIDYISTGAISILQVAGGILVVLGLSYNLFIDRKEKRT